MLLKVFEVKTDLPPLSLSIVILEKSLIVWNSVLAVDKSIRHISQSSDSRIPFSLSCFGTELRDSLTQLAE